MNITFAVATNSKYLRQTLPILFSSMERNGIQGNQIKVFVNEAEIDDVIIEKTGVTYYMCTETTYFEWIIPKLILKYNLKSDWWFLLHDTVILGDTFLEKVINCNNKNFVNIIMNSSMSNNMGLIKQEVFDKHRYYFENTLSLIKRCSHSATDQDDIFQRKLWIVHNENQYLKIEDYRYFYDNPNYHVLHPQVVKEYCGSLRRVEYFPSIDLYKMKQNDGTADLRWTL